MRAQERALNGQVEPKVTMKGENAKRSEAKRNTLFRALRNRARSSLRPRSRSMKFEPARAYDHSTLEIHSPGPLPHPKVMMTR